jgi:hypothetical protein
MNLSAIGRQFGLDEQETQAAFDALAPVVAAGIRRNAQSGEGDLGHLLGGLLNQGGAVDLASPQAIDSGNAVLGQIFGSKDVSRGVAQQISASTGIGESILKKLLPIIAAMVIGQLARKASGGGLGDILGSVLGGGSSGQSQGGGLGDILGRMLGDQQSEEPAQQPSSSGSIDDMLKDILGGGNSRGNAADDLLRSVEQALGRR